MRGRGRGQGLGRFRRQEAGDLPILAPRLLFQQRAAQPQPALTRPGYARVPRSAARRTPALHEIARTARTAIACEPSVSCHGGVGGRRTSCSPRPRGPCEPPEAPPRACPARAAPAAYEAAQGRAGCAESGFCARTAQHRTIARGHRARSESGSYAQIALEPAEMSPAARHSVLCRQCTSQPPLRGRPAPPRGPRSAAQPAGSSARSHPALGVLINNPRRALSHSTGRDRCTPAGRRHAPSPVPHPSPRPPLPAPQPAALSTTPGDKDAEPLCARLRSACSLLPHTMRAGSQRPHGMRVGRYSASELCLERVDLPEKRLFPRARAALASTLHAPPQRHAPSPAHVAAECESAKINENCARARPLGHAPERRHRP